MLPSSSEAAIRAATLSDARTQPRGRPVMTMRRAAVAATALRQWVATFVVLVVVGGAIPSAGAASSSRAATPDAARAHALLAGGVPFVPNAGRHDPRVAFVVTTFAGSVFVTTDGRLVYTLPPPT